MATHVHPRVKVWVARLRPLFPALVAIAFIEAVFVFVVSAGKVGTWPTYMAYYDLLAEGFRAGQLRLLLEPSRELLAAGNPYDPAVSQHWATDLTLYRGHYYFYWGPLPGLLLAAAKTVFRTSRPVGDQYLVFSFFSVAAIASTFLLKALRARLFPRVPLLLLVFGFFACALANPVPYLLASTSVYQAAISGGQAFLVLGVVLAFLAIRDSAPGSARPLWWLLSLAGASWGAAIACRLSLGPAVALLAVVTTLLGRGETAGHRLRLLARDAVLVGVPLALFCGGLLLYNKLRFDAWFESGIRWQLSGWPFRFSTRFFLPNLHQYFFRAPDWTCRFPYAVVPYEVPAAQVVPAWMPFRDGYATPEPVAGLGWAVPLVWVIPLGLVAVLAIMIKNKRGRASDGAWSGGWGDRDRRRLLLWCVLTFGTMSSVTMLAPLGLYLATMRYQADARFGLTLLGTLGIWLLYDLAPTATLRKVVLAGGVVACVATVAFALLLGFQGYTPHFARLNPQLAETLTNHLSFCPSR